MKSIRKILPAFAFSSVLMTQTLTAPVSVFAEETEEIVVSQSPQLGYSYANYVSSSLSISGGSAFCVSGATGNKQTTKISATQYLEKKSGTRWSMYKVWIQTSNGASFSMANGNLGISNGTYRLRTVFKVFSGSKYETITKCSPSKTVRGGVVVAEDEPEITLPDNSKIMDDVYDAINKGEELINVHIFYEGPDQFTIWNETEKLADEYVQPYWDEYYKTLESGSDEFEYTVGEILDLRVDKWFELREERYSTESADRLDEMTNFLSSLGVKEEPEDCKPHGFCVSAALTPEQIEETAKHELVTRITVNPYIVLENDLEHLVSDDSRFRNNELVYSDKYKFAIEHIDDPAMNRNPYDLLIVYDVPMEDTYGEWKKHLAINGIYIDLCWFPAGPGRYIWSGCDFHGVYPKNSKCRFERELEIMFFVNDELVVTGSGLGPVQYVDVETASRQYRFDVSRYIYCTEKEDIDEEMTATLTDKEQFSVLARETEICDGDINGDGEVNIADAIALQKALSERKAGAGMDFNGDGKVNVFDLMALQNILNG